MSPAGSLKLSAIPTRELTSVLILKSPRSGSGAGRQRIDELSQLLESRGLDVEVTTDIQRLRLRTGYVAERDPMLGTTDLRHDDDRLSGHMGTSEMPERPVVIAAGGDGTLALVAQNSPRQTVLLPMPMGTENLLARYFGFSSEPAQVIRALWDGTDQWLDAGLANGKLFLVMATCGFDAEVVRAMHLRRKGHISRFSYAGPITRALRRYQFPRLTVSWQTAEDERGEADSPLGLEARQGIDGQSDECGWAMVFNLPCYAASLGIEPEARGDDGQLNLMMLKQGSILHGLRYLGGIVTGRHIHWPDVARRRVVQCVIRADRPVAYQLDGDYGGRLPLTIRVLPHYLCLRVPRESAAH